MSARKKITIIWMVSSGVMLLLIMISAINDPPNVRSSIAWLVPSICPGIGVIIGL